MILNEYVARISSLILLFALWSAALVSGCADNSDQNGTSDTTQVDLIAPVPTDSSARADSLALRLASRYLRYSYQGASLRSTHPLSDSLLALRAGRGTGGPVTLVDTFYVEPEAIAHAGSTHTVRVRAPRALTVSRVWKTSNPQMDHAFTVRIEGSKVARAPRIVGWSALRSHVLKVEPDSGKAIVDRLRRRWTNLTKKRPGV